MYKNMNPQSDLKVLTENRKFILSLTSRLTDEQMLKIPEPFETNMLWQLGHIAASQQILHYILSGLLPVADESFLSSFRKGSSPKLWTETPERKYVEELFMSLPEKLVEDYNDGKFAGFKPYTTSTGVILNSINDSLAFNNYHEGIHTGKIQAFLKLL